MRRKKDVLIGGILLLRSIKRVTFFSIVRQTDLVMNYEHLQVLILLILNSYEI